LPTRDAEEFGPIVDQLVGHECERSLATNSIKLRFDTDADPRGLRYIWIEPPWTLRRGGVLVTTSDDYTDETFRAWSRHFDVLNRTTLVAWASSDDGTIFQFAHDYSIFVPAAYANREYHAWFDRWYARDKNDSPA